MNRIINTKSIKLYSSLAGLLALFIMSMAFDDVALSERLDRYKLLLLDNDFWFAYVSELSEDVFDDEGRNKYSMQDNGKDYTNYYVQATKAVSICYEQRYNAVLNTERVNHAKEIIQCCMSTFHEHGNFPRPKYKDLEYGWASSMDAPVIAMAAEMIYELTGEEEYKNYCLELLPYLIKSTDDGGYNLNSNSWPLEYAWVGVNQDSAWYVLNGSLVGYIATKAISNIYPSAGLSEYIARVERTYADMLEQFHKADSWSYYMLNPKGVIPIHYMIFEEKLFNAAKYLSNNQTFEREYEYRAKCLERVLKVDFFENGDRYDWFILRATAPHYYQIDTYSTKIEFLDSAGNVIFSKEAVESGSMQMRKDVFYKEMFCAGSIGELPDKYRVYANKDGMSFLLFESDASVSHSNDKSSINYSLDVARDATLSGDSNPNEITLVKSKDSKDEGDVVFQLTDLAPSEDVANWYGIEVYNPNANSINIGLILYDSEYNGVGRYYMPLVPGYNLVVFDCKGFENSEHLKDLSEIWLRVYDDDIEDGSVLHVGQLLQFSDLKTYYNYVNASQYVINPQ